jgi:hypothetical protein
MEEHLAKQADLANTGRKYAQSEAQEIISEAPPLPREGLEVGEDPEGGEPPPSQSS